MAAEFGQPLNLGHWQGRVDPDYLCSSLLEVLQDCPALLRLPSCRMLEESRNRVGVVSLPLAGERELPLVIKEFRTQGVDRLKSAFQLSKAGRAWRGSRVLVEAGLRTSCPVAYLERRGRFFLKQSFFLSEYLPEVREIRSLFRELQPDAMSGLVHDLAAFLSRCRRAGILHRDLSDGNILVGKDAEGTPHFFLLDTNRIRVKKKIGTLRAIKSVIRLGLPQPFRRHFLAAFLERPRIGGGLWAWYRTNKAAYTRFLAAKKALRVRKIAQKLKVQ